MKKIIENIHFIIGILILVWFIFVLLNSDVAHCVIIEGKSEGYCYYNLNWK